MCLSVSLLFYRACVCIQGPSEFKPLKCALTEEDRSQTGPR